jgi:hypothetical protein
MVCLQSWTLAGVLMGIDLGAYYYGTFVFTLGTMVDNVGVLAFVPQAFIGGDW